MQLSIGSESIDSRKSVMDVLISSCYKLVFQDYIAI